MFKGTNFREKNLVRKQVGQKGEQISGGAGWLLLAPGGLEVPGDPLEGKAQDIITERTLALGREISLQDK